MGLSSMCLQKAESQKNNQHSSENKQRHHTLWGTESMGGADLEKSLFRMQKQNYLHSPASLKQDHVS